MKSLILLTLSFVTITLNANASCFCNLTPQVYVPALPYDSRSQGNEVKKYPVDTWRDCYLRAIKMSNERPFEQEANICDSYGANCVRMQGTLFVGWYFWSDQSLVTMKGQVTRYTQQFDSNEVITGDRRFYDDGSMFP